MLIQLSSFYFFYSIEWSIRSVAEMGSLPLLVWFFIIFEDNCLKLIVYSFLYHWEWMLQLFWVSLLKKAKGSIVFIFFFCWVGFVLGYLFLEIVYLNTFLIVPLHYFLKMGVLFSGLLETVVSTLILCHYSLSIHFVSTYSLIISNFLYYLACFFLLHFLILNPIFFEAIRSEVLCVCKLAIRCMINMYMVEKVEGQSRLNISWVR